MLDHTQTTDCVPLSETSGPTGTRRNGGHLVAELLEAHRVRHAFGIDAPEWLWDAFDDMSIRAVITRDERSAGFAADSVARLTGTPAVASGLHGPGFTNLLTPMLEAKAACAPVLMLVSGVESTNFGARKHYQEADQVSIARSLAKWAVRVERADRIEEVIGRALSVLCAGRPGPVMVELPNDVLAERQPPQRASRHRRPEESRPPSVFGGLEEAARRLGGAEHLVVLAGNGARIAGARDVLVRFAEWMKAPVTITAMGRGVFPETHPLFAGVAGSMSNREDGSGWVANDLIRDADVLLVLGSSLDSITTRSGELPSETTFMIQVDIDPDQLALSQRADLVVHADARTALQALMNGLTPATSFSAQGALESRWATVRRTQDDRVSNDATPIAPARLFGDLRRWLRPDDIVACDASYASIWALNYLQEGRHFEKIVYARAAGTLGFGLPAAVGAACAFPDRRVVALVGDGGLGYGWSELETVARERLNVTSVVLNNGGFAYQQTHHRRIGGVSAPKGLEFGDVAHHRIADAVGVSGYRVERPHDLSEVLNTALEARGPSLVDVVIDPHVEPPVG